MSEISAIALFCEDLRVEHDNKVSLMGILGDNISVPSFPIALAKLAIYVRINYPTDLEPKALEISLIHPNNSRVVVSDIEKSFVEETLGDARAQDNPLAGIVTQLIATPFQIENAGRNRLELTWDTGSIFLGSLNITLAENSEAN